MPGSDVKESFIELVGHGGWFEVLSKEEQILGIGSRRCSRGWREEGKKYPEISSSSCSYPGKNS